ncbi:HTH-type transcriptional activator IlvY [Desulfospira joergensenii]|uniref:HTH-type transcriptional activator IlvY n=1 Tax=Desulfospira joergensenii TaxID=53329 RepID=UPI0003B682C9|nr:HTH-type transcriptional activator IlvY [Desulfospira joergensenii]
MDIRALKLFRHLAGSLHFARTSMACNMTPSALTRMIQRLEADVGERLFVRDNRSVELTHAGLAFKKYADDVIRRWETLQEELSEDEVLQGELSLFCSVTAAYAILPNIINTYRQAHPKVQIHLETGDPARALDKLRNRDADVVIAAMPRHLDKGIEFMELTASPLVFIGPRRFPGTILYREDKKIDWEKTPFIIPDTGLSRERLDIWFAENQILPNVYSQVSGHEAIIALVSLGCGIGLIPRLVLEKSPVPKDVIVLEKAPELPAFILGLCTLRKNLSNARIKALWTLAGGQGKDSS